MQAKTVDPKSKKSHKEEHVTRNDVLSVQYSKAGLTSLEEDNCWKNAPR